MYNLVVNVYHLIHSAKLFIDFHLGCQVGGKVEKSHKNGFVICFTLFNITKAKVYYLIYFFNNYIFNIAKVSKSLLVSPRINTQFYGARSFQSSAPELWNNIPDKIKTSKTIDQFKAALKTHYFMLNN